MIPQKIKERIQYLGDNFSDKESRDELYKLINSYLHRGNSEG